MKARSKYAMEIQQRYNKDTTKTQKGKKKDATIKHLKRRRILLRGGNHEISQNWAFYASYVQKPGS